MYGEIKIFYYDESSFSLKNNLNFVIANIGKKYIITFT